MLDGNDSEPAEESEPEDPDLESSEEDVDADDPFAAMEAMLGGGSEPEAESDSEPEADDVSRAQYLLLLCWEAISPFCLCCTRAWAMQARFDLRTAHGVLAGRRVCDATGHAGRLAAVVASVYNSVDKAYQYHNSVL